MLETSRREPVLGTDGWWGPTPPKHSHGTPCRRPPLGIHESTGGAAGEGAAGAASQPGPLTCWWLSCVVLLMRSNSQAWVFRHLPPERSTRKRRKAVKRSRLQQDVAHVST
ncbi:hypothetical protein ACJZ2D_014658 [Fusarium nematophilum]